MTTRSEAGFIDKPRGSWRAAVPNIATRLWQNRSSKPVAAGSSPAGRATFVGSKLVRYPNDADPAQLSGRHHDSILRFTLFWTS